MDESNKIYCIARQNVLKFKEIYNAEKYISEAIDSILHQTYSNWELIIVDDASTDRSAELIQAYVRRDLRISAYVNQEKKGAGAARNLAISHCTGKYVAFLDADDISNRKRLEKQADFLDKNKNYGAVGTQAKLVDQDSRIMGETKNPSAWCSIKKVMLFRCPFVNSSMMFRKCMVDKYGVWMNESMSFGEDYLFWINMSEHCRMHNLKEYLTLYRINTNGLSYQWINKMKISEQCCDGHLKLYQVLWDRKGLNTDKYNTNALVNALSGKNIESIFEFFVNLRNVVRYGMTICGNKYDDIIVQFCIKNWQTLCPCVYSQINNDHIRVQSKYSLTSACPYDTCFHSRKLFSQKGF